MMDVLVTMASKLAEKDKQFSYRQSSFMESTRCYGLVSQGQVEGYWSYLASEAREIARAQEVVKVARVTSHSD